MRSLALLVNIQPLKEGKVYGRVYESRFFAKFSMNGGIGKSLPRQTLISSARVLGLLGNCDEELRFSWVAELRNT